MAIWDGIESAVASSKLPFLNKGSYRVSLVAAEEGMGGLTKEPYFRATYRVVSATGEGATPVGATACVVIKRDKFGYYLRDIKSLVAAILNESPAAVTGELVQALVDGNEASGVEFLIDVAEEPKKNGAGTILKHRFFAAPVTAPIVPEPAIVAAAPKPKGKQALA